MNLFPMLLAICVGAGAFTLFGISVTRRLVRRGVDESHNDISAAIFGVGGTIYAVFLAFLVITVWQAHDAAVANAADEASLLCTLYRGTSAMDPETGGKLRAVIRDYTQAVITDEWSVEARTGDASQKARAAGLKMFGVFGTATAGPRQNEQAIDTTQLELIGQIQSDRNKRILQAGESLSPVIWLVAIVSGILVLCMSFTLYSDRDWPHVIMSGMLAAMIFMLVYVMYVFNQPFGGLMPLQPSAFVHALEVYDSVDHTP